MSDIINHIDGFTVAYLAADGEEGYAYLSKQNDIDVVMTDIDMPKMDGLTLIQKVEGSRCCCSIYCIQCKRGFLCSLYSTGSGRD